MNEHDCQACGEYYQLSRRGFMKLSGATLLALGAPGWLPRVALARDDDSTRDVLVSIYLRGGADGLTLCVPYGDAAYYAARTHGTAIAAPDGSLLTAQALSTSTMFGLPPAMASLVTPYEDGKLAIVHATGWKVPNPSRSHFDAQRWMELGKFNDPTVFTGWLGRHLANTGAVVPSDPVRAIGVANGLQAHLLGAPEAIPVPGLAGASAPNFNLGGSTSTRQARRKALDSMYAAVPDPMKSAARITQQTIDLLNSIPFSTYTPAGGAIYPTSSFGYSLKSAAALIKNNMGVEAVAVDRSGWDTHSNQGVIAGGSMFNTMKDVADALNAFYIDVVENYNRNVVVVMMSEFGRRVADNATAGTDHGYGNAMFLLGNRINGRQVLSLATSGEPGWPGLGPGQLFQNLDLNVTLDFRDVLGEVCQNLLNDPDLSGPNGVFPGYIPTFRGLTT